MNPHLADEERITSLITLLLFVGALALLVGFIQRPEFSSAALSKISAVNAEKGVQIDPHTDPRGHATQARMQQIQQRFEQAVVMLHAKQYEHAMTALHEVLKMAPRMPEAHVNMGFALLGVEDYKAAGDFFATAIRLKPYQGNAYWGLAISLEKLGDKEAALGAMRTYIHLAPAGDPFVTKARAALWEWEAEIKRGPLAEEEESWLESQGRQWEERNRADVDIPGQGERELELAVP